MSREWNKYDLILNALFEVFSSVMKYTNKNAAKMHAPDAV